MWCPTRLYSLCLLFLFYIIFKSATTIKINLLELNVFLRESFKGVFKIILQKKISITWQDFWKSGLKCPKIGILNTKAMFISTCDYCPDECTGHEKIYMIYIILNVFQTNKKYNVLTKNCWCIQLYTFFTKIY